jgi:hypothetical protein
MEGQVLAVFGRSVYGKVLLYPANYVANEFAALLGVKSFSQAQLVRIAKLGFAIQSVQDPELAAAVAVGGGK